MLVIDASVAVELVLRSPAAEPLADTLFAEAERWHAPHLLAAHPVDATASDALYVALAEGLGATLVTRDGRLARAVERVVAVRVV